MQKKLDVIKKTIAAKEKHLPKDPGGWFLFSHILYPLITQYFRKIRFSGMEKSFYADPACTGCGICEEICLSGKIKMKNGKPHWQSNIPCTYCFACIHFCPARAIQIKNRNTCQRGRYHHPSIKATDIMEQKECTTPSIKLPVGFLSVWQADNDFCLSGYIEYGHKIVILSGKLFISNTSCSKNSIASFFTVSLAFYY
ncbi:MAG TPA: hypothetical protein ENN63_06730 [Bacteroidetes bacterium]|nr:hypothetical protein [Bacteroidota bacterium]